MIQSIHHDDLYLLEEPFACRLGKGLAHAADVGSACFEPEIRFPEIRFNGVCRKEEAATCETLSYQVGVELIERLYGERIHFVVDGEAAALSTPGERTFDDDLIPVLDRNSAGHFEHADAVGQ